MRIIALNYVQEASQPGSERPGYNYEPLFRRATDKRVICFLHFFYILLAPSSTLAIKKGCPDLPRLPRWFLLFSLFLSALLMVCSLSPAHAQGTNLTEIRIIYLVPSDRSIQNDYVRGISGAIQHLQAWYHQQMGGKTFKLHNPIVEIKKTRHVSSWYRSTPNGDQSVWFWNNVIGDGFSLTGGNFNDPKYRWVYYIDAENASGQIGGGGTSGVCVLPEHDLLGLIGKHPTERNVCRWVGGLGHELGHALNLPHPPECDSGTLPQSDAKCQSLMYLGYLIYPNTVLLPEDKVKLNQGGFMQNIAPLNTSVDCADLLFLAGDVSQDGAVTIGDAVMVLRHIASLKTLSTLQRKRADLAPKGAPDGKIDTADAVLLLRHVVGLEA